MASGEYSPQSSNEQVAYDVPEPEIHSTGQHGVKLNLGYFQSFPGILRMATTVLSLIAFIVCISVPRCTYGRWCLPQHHLHTYSYFGVMSFLTFFGGFVMTVYNVTGHAKAYFREIIFYFVDTLFLSVSAFLLAFAVLFMIGANDGKIFLQIATVFGTGAFIFLAIHLVYLCCKLRALWLDGQRIKWIPSQGKEDKEISDERNDYSPGIISEDISDDPYTKEWNILRAKNTTAENCENSGMKKIELKKNVHSINDLNSSTNFKCSESDDGSCSDEDMTKNIETKKFRKIDCET